MNTILGNNPNVADLDSNPGKNSEHHSDALQGGRAMEDQVPPLEAQESVDNEAGNAAASLSDCTKKLNVTVPSRIDSKNENQSVASQQIPEDQAKSDALTSFGEIEDYYPNETRMMCPSSDVTNDKICSAYSDADVELYKEFTRDSPNLYTKLLDESLLLDCENFVNFELDKDRIIVLNIKDAKEKSNSILEQHAISNARSKDLPACPF